MVIFKFLVSISIVLVAAIRTLAFLAPVVLALWWVVYELGTEYPLWGLSLLIPFTFYVFDRDRYPWFQLFAYSMDQNFNTYFKHYLNFILNPRKHLFGAPDETVSSVIGKNIRTGDLRLHWQYIELILRFCLEGNKRPHSINSIENDEGIKK